MGNETGGRSVAPGPAKAHEKLCARSDLSEEIGWRLDAQRNDVRRASREIAKLRRLGGLAEVFNAWAQFDRRSEAGRIKL